ncbi:MAG: sulfatase-like hydrolase/transferase [Actinomycetes bacterium]
MRRVPVHPLLLACVPVLMLWVGNRAEVTTEQALPVLGGSVLVTLVVWGLAAARTRELRSSALIASVAVVVLGTHGYHLGLLGPAVGLALALLLVAAAGVLVVTRLHHDERLGATTSIVNVVAIALVVANALPLALAPSAPAAPAAVGATPDAAFVADEDAPDVWYVVLDRFPRRDVAADVLGADTGPFLTGLEARGFQVAEQARANYPKTAHSLASSLNLTTLEALAGEPGDDWQPVYRLLRDHRLGHLLTDAGYRYVHVGSWWSPTASATTADEVVRSAGDEFADVFASTTVLPAFRSLAGEVDAREELRREKRDVALRQFDALAELAAAPSDVPRFVFAHITLPHEPYVFEADGAWVPRDVERQRSRDDNFRRQLAYTEARATELVDAILAGAPADRRPPVVVVQSDEGPHPEARVAQGPAYRWDLAPDDELREKLGVLLAVHGVDVALPEDVTPASLWPRVLADVLGAELPVPDDRTWVFPDETQLYTFLDVTDRLR